MNVRSHRRSFATLALGLSLALGLAACGSSAKKTDSGGSDNGATTTSTIKKVAGLGDGVTADKVKVGIVLVDYDLPVIKANINFNRGDQKKIYQAMIDDINAKGGVAGGKMIEPVFRTYIPIGSSDPLKACTQMTEDEKVFATIGVLIDESGAGPLCFTKQHKSILITHELSESTMKKSNPGLLLTYDTLAERTTRTLVALAKQKKLLEGKKFGIVAQTSTESRIDSAIKPSLLKAGVELGSEGVLAVGDNPDHTQADAQLDALIEKWKTEDVNAVFISGLSAVSKDFVTKIKAAFPDVLIMTDADSSARGAGQDAVAAKVNPNPYDGIISLTGLTDAEQFKTEKLQGCVAIWEKASGTKVTSPEDVTPGPDGKRKEIWITVRDACQEMDFFKVVADRVGKDLNLTNWVNTINTFGQTDELVATDAASFGPGKYDGNNNFSLSEFDPTAGTGGDWKALTPLADVTETLKNG